jgi:hypothetical protein
MIGGSAGQEQGCPVRAEVEMFSFPSVPSATPSQIAHLQIPSSFDSAWSDSCRSPLPIGALSIGADQSWELPIQNAICVHR